MNKSVATIIGIAIVAGGAIWFSKSFLGPASERKQAEKKVLSGAYAAQLELCTFLEDSELPKGIEAPDIASDLRYVRVVVLFPEVKKIAGAPREFVLSEVNGQKSEQLTPVDAGLTVEEDGVVLTLTYLTDTGFEFARLNRGEHVIIKKVMLE